MSGRLPIRTGARALAAVALASCLLGLGLVPRASAVALPGSASFSVGLSDDRAFLLDAGQSVWLARARTIGSTAVRLGVPWSTVAPAVRPAGFNPSDPRDPHYDWTFLDTAVRDATANGQTVVLSVSHAPAWAEGPDRPSVSLVLPGAWEPSSVAFGQFARALALRYSGRFPDPLRPHHTLPQVRYYQAWNEPNYPRYIMPQWYQAADGSLVPASPGIYRALLNAFYAGVKSVSRNDVVLAAGTGPYGDPPGAPRDQMYPVQFYQELFCLTPDSRACPSGPPHFDVLDHHPYAATPSLHARNAGDISVPDIGKIWQILRAAQRVHHALPAGPKSIWVTEIDWATIPPLDVTVPRQTRFLSLSFYVLWREKVSRVFWYLIQDPLGQGNSFSFGGLFSHDAVPKPAAAAFHFPFVAVGGHHGMVTLWGLAPHAGTVEIDVWRGHRWRTVLSLPTSDGRCLLRPAHSGHPPTRPCPSGRGRQSGLRHDRRHVSGR